MNKDVKKSIYFWSGRLLLSISATGWLLSIYWIKTRYFYDIIDIISSVLGVLFPIMLSGIAVFFLDKGRKDDEADNPNVSSIRNVDMELLPAYLGYFFVALSIPNLYTCIWIYIVILLFSCLTQACYFNPILLLYGYHFYRTETQSGTTVLLILKGKVLRNIGDLEKNKKYIQIHNAAYIEKRKG